MTLQTLFGVLRARWKLVLAGLLTCIIVASVLLAFLPKKYDATATLYVTTSARSNDPSGLFDAGQLSEQRVKSYSELVTGTRVASEVATALNLDVPPEELAKQVSVASQPDTVLMNVTVEADSPEQAVLLTRTYATASSALVGDLERPIDPSQPPAIIAKVVQEPVLPMSAAWPSPALFLSAGVLIGFALGVLLALISDLVDRNVKDITELVQLTEAPMLGVVSDDDRVSAAPLVVRDRPQDPIAEEFRRIRTNIQFTDPDRVRSVFVFSSSNASEGKTTTCVNVALALADSGSRVLLIDADLRRPKAAQVLGLSSAVGLTTVLSHRIQFREATQHQRSMGLEVLASGQIPPNPSEMLASQRMVDLLNEARKSYDYVLIDAPPVLPVTDAALVAARSDGVVMICRYGSTTSAQLTEAVQSFKNVSSRIVGSIMTMSQDPQRSRSGAYSYYSTTPENLDQTDKLKSSELEELRDSKPQSPSPRPR